MSRLIDRVPAHVRDFESYRPSPPDEVLMRQYGAPRLYRLNNNENPLGPPPLSLEAMAAYDPKKAAVYPGGDCYFLRHALGERFGRDPEQFLAGNGSCEIIGSVIKAFCQPGDSIIAADKTFAVYEWVGRVSGLDVRLIPLRDQTHDPEAMLAAVTDRTRIVFLCNPNNPTGTWWSRKVLERFLSRLGGRAIAVVDEAYREFVDEEEFPDGLEMADRHANVLVFRTFSKMYGLAGLRVGYLYGSKEAVDIARRAHTVYSVNALGQLAAAAALKDDAGHIAATRRMAAEARSFLVQTFEALGLEYVSGQGNFIMVHLPCSDTLLYRRLMRQGVMARTMTGFRFPNWLRVTLVGEEAMQAFAKAFRKALDLA